MCGRNYHDSIPDISAFIAANDHVSGLIVYHQVFAVSQLVCILDLIVAFLGHPSSGSGNLRRMVDRFEIVQQR